MIYLSVDAPAGVLVTLERDSQSFFFATDEIGALEFQGGMYVGTLKMTAVNRYLRKASCRSGPCTPDPPEEHCKGGKIMNSSLLKASSILESKGYKMTSQRKKVFQCISKCSDQHLSAEEIYDIVRKKDASVGFATVYRALDAFEKSGILQHLFFDDGSKRYHLVNVNEKDDHYHLVCEICGRIIDVKKEDIESLVDKVFLNKGFIINDQKVQIFGICDRCIKDTSSLTIKKSEE